LSFEETFEKLNIEVSELRYKFFAGHSTKQEDIILFIANIKEGENKT